MGASQSSNGMTDARLAEYEELSYLSRAEIMSLLKSFAQMLPPLVLEQDFNCRVHFTKIMEHFPQIASNPFRDRICFLFSSQGDDCFSFEDLLDFYSVMSENCPDGVKTTWAFRMFDFDDDNGIGENDLMVLIDRLTNGFDNNNKKHQMSITAEEKRDIATKILNEMDIESSGLIGQLAFEHGVGKMSEFSNAFSVRV